MEGSYASPSATADYTAPVASATGLVQKLFGQMNGWSWALTILLVLVAWDQCEQISSGVTKTAMLIGLPVSYQKNKAGIVGPAWKIPFIGPFLESMNPKMEIYQNKWKSGDLSCVSVFHKYVILQHHGQK